MIVVEHTQEFSGRHGAGRIWFTDMWLRYAGSYWFQQRFTFTGEPSC